jgi:hypothetical protein
MSPLYFYELAELRLLIIIRIVRIRTLNFKNRQNRTPFSGRVLGQGQKIPGLGRVRRGLQKA